MEPSREEHGGSALTGASQYLGKLLKLEEFGYELQT